MSSPSLSNIIFLDIETVPFTNDFNGLSDRLKSAWAKKASYLRTDVFEGDDILYKTKAGIFAEFGRIVCISIGVIVEKDGQNTLRIKSIYGHDEKDLLIKFCELLNVGFKNKDIYFCAHNGKEFDFPYICRRLLINRLQIPNLLNIAGKKPWEVKHLDTLDLWKFGDYKHYTSLDLLATIFNIPTSKDDIDGSQVASVYYNDNDLERIKIYCEKDVSVLTQVYLSMTSNDLIEEDQIIFV